MATTTGDDLYRVDISDGTDTVQHAIKDAAARADISNLKTALSEYLLLNTSGISWVNDKRLYTGTGAVSDSTGYSYTKIPVENYEGVLVVTTAARSPAASVVFYDANDNYISDVTAPGTADFPNTVTATIPTGTRKIGISCYTTYISSASILYSAAKTITEINKKYEPFYDLNNNLPFYELANTKLSNTNGTVIKGQQGYVCSNLIAAHFGQYITFTKGTGNYLTVAAYDSTGTFISVINTSLTAVLPKNTAYIRIGSQRTTLKDCDVKLIEAPIRKIDDEIYTMNGTRIITGGIMDNAYSSGYYTSWYMDVSEAKKLVITVNRSTGGGGIYFYDSSFSYISDSVQSLYDITSRKTNIIYVPSSAVYAVFNTTGSVGFQGFAVGILNDEASYREVYIGTGRQYISILSALKNEAGLVKFFVEAGEYNIVNEYKAIYGDSFWSDYEGYSGKLDQFLRGLALEIGQQIYFGPDTKIVFDYDGDNQYVFEQFSVFNLTSNNIIDGATIEFGTQVCRYAIHDDQASDYGANIIRNCIFNGRSYNGPVIGGGCGIRNSYYIEGCLFENNGGYTDISYHNSLNSGAKSFIHVKDCKGDKGVSFLYCGDSQLVSTYIVSNSKFPSIQLNAHPGASHPYENVRLVEYCNDKTPIT